jgi:hypothetical protein
MDISKQAFILVYRKYFSYVNIILFTDALHFRNLLGNYMLVSDTNLISVLLSNSLLWKSFLSD